MQRSGCTTPLIKNRNILRILCVAHFLFLFSWFTSNNFQWLPDAEEDSDHLLDWLIRPSFTETNQSAKPTKTDEWDWARDVSVVYTWVNGSDPDQTAARVQYGGPKSSGLYRDHEDLRYSLRTWVNNAPWHRGNIFIVSQTPPTWLNQSHPRIKWICQDVLLPANATPTFSNYVVEQFLHLIPGLSDHFIHMNDDYMIDRLTEPTDFFTASGGTKFYFDSAFISPDVKTSGGSGWLKSLWTTLSLLEKHYPHDNRTSTTRYRYLKHAPYVYHREAFFRIHEKFDEALSETRTHRFRTPGDILWPYVYYGFLVNEGPQCCALDFDFVRDGPGKAVLMMWSTNMEVNREATRDLNARNPLFLTVNDDMGVDDQEAIDAAHNALVRFYERRYGHFAGVFENNNETDISE